jgi:hypothetical protein
VRQPSSVGALTSHFNHLTGHDCRQVVCCLVIV